MAESGLFTALIKIVAMFNNPDQDKRMLAAAGVEMEAAAFPIFMAIGRLPRAAVGDVAKVVGKSYSSVSRQIDKLERGGLIVTMSDATDARVRLATLSARGDQITASIVQARTTIMDAAFADWTDSQRTELQAGLEHLERTMREVNKQS